MIEEMLFKIKREQNIKIKCSVFFDDSTLGENIKCGSFYDLIYHDIEIHKVNGISVAELIRTM